MIFSALVALAAMLLARGSAAHLEILWDEQVDHDIAVSLRDDPLRGESPALDASQTRLPMYLCAIAMKLTGQTDLQICRDVSLILGGVTIVLTAALAHLLFGGWTALLTAAVLGLSPYFLSFARIAMTEGDVVFSCAVVAAILAYLGDLRKPTPTRWLLASITLGFAIGAKLFAVFLVPVFALMATSSTRRGRLAAPAPAHADDPASDLWPQRFRLYLPLIFAVAATLISAFVAAILSREWAVLGWAVVFASWVYTASIALLRRSHIGRTPPRRLVSIIAFAFVTFFALMPVHLTAPDILHEIARRTLRWDNSLPLALWSDHLRLYAGILLIKLSIPFGVLTAIALVYAAFAERGDGRWRPCIITVIYYIVFVCFLPLRQTFYLMGIYPFVAITVCAFAVDTVRRLRRRSRAAAWAGAALLIGCLMHLGLRLANAYPYFQFYGYDQVGDRWLGTESRGYRNLIQTPSDGVQELLHWCADSRLVRPGDRIVSYLWEDRIVANTVRVLPRRLNLTTRGLTEETDTPPGQPSIDQADWVLLHINNRLGYGDRPPDWPPRALLEAQFRVIYTVRRGPMEVAWVYGRRDRPNS